MAVALLTTSHSPLIGLNDPPENVTSEVEAVLDDARAFVRAFDPELVVIFGPDHYNGFLYDMMPSFCIGASAVSVGDYGLPAGPIPVDRDTAYALTTAVLDSGVDVAISEDMQVDHGFVQPLMFLFGKLGTVPIVPIFINCVAEPLGPASRSRLLGEAVGKALACLDKRVLIVGSGGLSHDPPVPRLEDATPEVVERLKHGRNPTAEQRHIRESGTVKAAAEFAAGSDRFQSLNPEWDATILSAFVTGDLAAVDRNSNEWFVENGGHSSHEIRTWIAAYGALSASGAYKVASTYYRAIPEWFAGFSVTTAAPNVQLVGTSSKEGQN
jgi:2,3-dihydroxyphenylpropionate 1,2-dioxygenase